LSRVAVTVTSSNTQRLSCAKTNPAGMISNQQQEARYSSRLRTRKVGDCRRCRESVWRWCVKCCAPQSSPGAHSVCQNSRPKHPVPPPV
jgi:hypothetical protein